MSEKHVLHYRVLDLRDSGQLEQALAAANGLVAEASHDPNAWEVLGTVLIELGRHEDAISAYSAAIGRAANLPHEQLSTFLGGASPWYNRAAQYARLGRRDEALADLREAVDRAPGWADMVPSDERFQNLSTDPELTQIVERGHMAQKDAEALARETSLQEHRAAAIRLFDESKEFTSPELTEHVRGTVLGVIDGVMLHSNGEDVTQLIEVAFAGLRQAITSVAPESREMRLIQRAAHELIHIALLYHLHELVDRFQKGPWWN